MTMMKGLEHLCLRDLTLLAWRRGGTKNVINVYAYLTEKWSLRQTFLFYTKWKQRQRVNRNTGDSNSTYESTILLWRWSNTAQGQWAHSEIEKIPLKHKKKTFSIWVLLNTITSWMMSRLRAALQGRTCGYWWKKTWKWTWNAHSQYKKIITC